MDFRQARLALAALFFVVAGCAQMPGPGTSSIREASVPQAPAQAESALRQLAVLAGSARIEAALAWAQDYLAANRPQDAATLLDRVSTTDLNQGQRYRWLRLQAQIAMAQQQPERALSLLDAHQNAIDGLDPQRRARINLLRADALALSGQALESLRLRVLADPMLNADDQRYNRELTWHALMDLPLDTLRARAADSAGDLQGWLRLALLYRDPQASIEAQMQSLRQWQQQWPTHPAAQRLPAMLNALQEAANQRPQQVAVLLPESGPLAAAADAIRHGIMTAYYSAQAAGNTTPELRFYDSSRADVQRVYQRAIHEGADFVLGPLAKDKVEQIAAMGRPAVTTLALNYLDDGSRAAPIFQFGLAPEDEARQVARRTLREGHRYAGVLYPDSDWGRRVSQAFMNAFQQGGGQIAVQRAYRDDNIGAVVQDLMESARTQQAQAGFPSPRRTEYQPHPGQDMSVVFLVADPNQGRRVKPALNFHYARHLPVYSTSYIYDGTPSPRRDNDLDGIHYLDMPWVLQNDGKLHRMAAQAWPEGHGIYTRLFAMGIDAYRLQARLPLLLSLPGSELPGVTGDLHLDGARLIRESDWAIFRNGRSMPLPPPSAARIGQP